MKITKKEIVEDYKQLFKLAQDYYPNATIAFSSILPRWDEDNARVKEINKQMMSVCQEANIEFLPTWRTFQHEQRFYKYGHTR